MLRGRDPQLVTPVYSVYVGNVKIKKNVKKRKNVIKIKKRKNVFTSTGNVGSRCGSTSARVRVRTRRGGPLTVVTSVTPNDPTLAVTIHSTHRHRPHWTRSMDSVILTLLAHMAPRGHHSGATCEQNDTEGPRGAVRFLDAYSRGVVLNKWGTPETRLRQRF